MPGKHVKPRQGIDSTPRGPARWERAVVNAVTKPTSHGGKLYWERASVAREFLDFEEADRPFEHITVNYAGQSDQEISRKREYVTCNMFCAAMQVQLDHGVRRYDQVLAIFEGNYRRTYTTLQGQTYLTPWQVLVRALDRRTLSRTVRCQVCGSSVKPERA